MERGQDRGPLDSVADRGGTRQRDLAAADYGLHQHYDRIVLRMAESACSQESEHGARAVLTAGSKKLLDHVEGGVGRNLQRILLRPGRFALSTEGTVVVGQSHKDAEPAFRVLTQVEFSEIEAPELVRISGDSRLVYALWSPDGRSILTCWADGSVRLSESAPWEEVSTSGDPEAPFEDKLRLWRQERRRK